MKAGRVFWIVVLGMLILTGLFMALSGFYTDLLWFQGLGYLSVFWTQLWVRVALFAVGLVIFVLIYGINVWLALRQFHEGPLVEIVGRERPVSRGMAAVIAVAGGLIVGLSIAGAAGAQWEAVLRYLNRVPFGVADPTFEQDVGFYVFTLPIYRFLQGWLLAALFISLIASAGLYMLARWSQIQHRIYTLTRPMANHLLVLGALLGLLLAWGYRLDRYGLLYSTRGVVFGASYTDVHAQLLAYNVLSAIVLLGALLLLAATVTRSLLLPVGAVAVWIAALVVLGSVYPALLQRYVVEPNEFVREEPYIEYNIQFTRQAYGLTAIEEQEVDPRGQLTPEYLAKEQATIRNVRLWDYRPLLQTYSQIQEIRLYYDFVDVDIDRYRFDGEYQQVMLAPRELAVEQLQNRTWVNEHLEFTHGYGLVMSPVGEVTSEGLPQLLIKDLPLKTAVDLSIDHPQVYYGEKASNYVFVNTDVEEFDYPRGESNVRTRYAGQGGVELSAPFSKPAFALRFGDSQILFAQALRPQSRVMFYRNIHDRVRRVAPFLSYDADPYLVVADGRLVWLQDAYTTSNGYPYSTPSAGGHFNYIRNSVKVAIDAYDGRMTFYIADPEDPIIQAYMRIYPALFKPIAEMPASLRQHIRYPEGLFRIQAQIYRIYHMGQANTFYNKEDVWDIPEEVFQGESLPMEPYYVIMRLLGEEQEEFLLIQPFTPATKNNMIAWLAARSDGDKYGQFIVYKFPKQELIYGPLQIEARIDQDASISSQLSLWNQRGSQVIRGNLLVIPVADSLLYVEPLYLQAEAGRLPEFKRAIVASGDKVVMEETLEAALAKLVGVAPATEATRPAGEAVTPPVEGPAVEGDMAELARSAQAHYQAAQEALKAGDWARYGEELAALQRDLDALVELTSVSSEQ